jgi:membrane protease YdiL (CAAX protease family)
MEASVKHGRLWFREHRLLWGLVLIFPLWVLRVVSNLAWRHWFGTTDIHETLPFALFLLSSSIVASTGLVGGGIVWLTGTSWRELGWRRQGLAKAIGLGMLGFVLHVMSLIPLILLSGGGAPYDYVRPSPARVLLVTFFAFGYAPWIEENLFRGYLQPLLAEHLPLGLAVVTQAALFTLAHTGYATSLSQFGWLFVSGMIFGWLRGRDRSLVAPYLAHALGWMMTLFGPPAF